MTEKEELLNKLQDVSATECVRLLREMPLCFSEKRRIRYIIHYSTDFYTISDAFVLHVKIVHFFIQVLE